MTPYPVALDLRNRPCTVLGGSALAARRADDLVVAGAVVTVVARAPVRRLVAAAAAGAVTLHRRRPSPADLCGAWLAIDATGDPALGPAVLAAAERLRVLLNVVDRPEQCHFHAPAVVRRDPLRVAVSTGGASPFVAAAVRRLLERELGPEWGPFTALVGRVRRRLRARGVPPGRQQAVYRRLLRSSVRSLLRQGEPGRAERAAAAIASDPDDRGFGGVTLVGAGPGDPGLLTLAARERLATADVVLHDALVHPDVLALCGDGTRRIAVGRRSGEPGPDPRAVIRRMIGMARAGQDVVRLKGGDPLVFGRGWEETRALRAAGVRVAVVPGVSSVTAAPAAAGIALTRRGAAGSIGVVSGHGDGGDDWARLERMAAAADTLVVLMPLRRLAQVAARLATVLGPDRPAALIGAAGWPEERVVRGPVAAIAAGARRSGLVAPATLVVGLVAEAVPAPPPPEVAPRSRRSRVRHAGAGRPRPG